MAAGSIFTSLVTEVLAMPDGASVTIRKLAPKHLEAAAKASQRAALDQLAAIGGPAELAKLRALEAPVDGAAVAARDPMLSVDRLLILQAGITAWTYPVALTPEALEDVDDETADQWARAILRLSKPSLFAEFDAEVDRKNGSAGSIAHSTGTGRRRSSGG